MPAADRPSSTHGAGLPRLRPLHRLCHLSVTSAFAAHLRPVRLTSPFCTAPAAASCCWPGCSLWARRLGAGRQTTPPTSALRRQESRPTKCGPPTSGSRTMSSWCRQQVRIEYPRAASEGAPTRTFLSHQHHQHPQHRFQAPETAPPFQQAHRPWRQRATLCADLSACNPLASLPLSFLPPRLLPMAGDTYELLPAALNASCKNPCWTTPDPSGGQFRCLPYFQARCLYFATDILGF